jgi:subtilisin family serine protease
VMLEIKNNRLKTTILLLLLLVGVATFITMHNVQNDSDEYAEEQWYFDGIEESAETYVIERIQEDNVTLITRINDARENGQSSNPEDTIVAVIDTIVDWSHEDINGVSWSNADEVPNDGKDNDNNGYVDDVFGYDFLNGKGIATLTPNSPGAHGTAIAGLIASNMKNDIGIAGIVGNAHIKLMNLAVLDPITSEGSVDNLVGAIRYAECNGAKICNISSNYPMDDINLRDTIQRSKMLFIVSAGNRPTLGLSLDKVVNIPANYNSSNVITVSSYTKEYRIVRQANFGQNTVDVLAPGDEILAPIPGDEYAYFSGTSISTPIVTALAALLDQAVKGETAVELRNQVLSLTVKRDEFDNKIKDGATLNLAVLSLNKP